MDGIEHPSVKFERIGIPPRVQVVVTMCVKLNFSCDE